MNLYEANRFGHDAFPYFFSFSGNGGHGEVIYQYGNGSRGFFADGLTD
jgi:hypothetical protein